MELPVEVFITRLHNPTLRSYLAYVHALNLDELEGHSCRAGRSHVSTRTGFVQRRNPGDAAGAMTIAHVITVTHVIISTVYVFARARSILFSGDTYPDTYR